MRFQKIILFILIFIIPFCFSYSAEKAPLILPEDNDMILEVNNRILAVVGEKPITLVDVMKKMDMIFYRQYPQYTSSKMARFQFYQVSWKNVLEDLIDKELLLADAEHTKLEVTNGDVRQEMEDIFAPSIIANLDKAGLSMDDAWQMVHDDIVIRRMLIYNVNNKAMRNVNPQDIRKAYAKYVEEHAPTEEWVYQVISIRNPNESENALVADKLGKYLAEQTIVQPDSQIEKFKKTENNLETQITISQEFNHKVEEIADNYKEILKTLSKGSVSIPIPQKNRKDNTTFYRIFYLKDKTIQEVKPFTLMANELKNKLTSEAIAVETELYLGKLRNSYGIKKEHLKEMIPQNFQPFTIKMKHY